MVRSSTFRHLKVRADMFLFYYLASSNGFDVVLIDTAGRMQDNEPLMRALAKVCPPVSISYNDSRLIASCVAARFRQSA